MIRQVVHVLFLATALQCAIAVINSSTSKATDEVTDNTKNTAINKIADSASASTEQKGNRREAADHSSPQVIEETYLVLPNSKPNLPVPVYGVPSAVKYPGPPPDIPPPPSVVPILPISYGSPPSGGYGPPIPNFNKLPPPIQQHYGPPVRQVFFSLPQKNYGPPPPKISKPINVFLKAPTPLYGAPFPARPYPPKQSISTYKVPKPIYGVPPKYPKIPKPLYGPPTGPLNSYGPPAAYIGVPLGFAPPGKGTFETPKDSYGVPVKNVPLPIHIPKQLPPQPPLAPPGIPAPPTPPDIKYDGWQPILGLVSKPPSAYGAPNAPKHNSIDLNINSDFVPPPLEVEDHQKNGQGFSDSYSAPLNSVTGSGGVVSSSGLALKPEPGDDITLSLGLSSLGIQSGRESLSVIKSIDYDLSQFGNLLNVQLPLPGSSGGLIPPSGVYGAPPSGHYGTPLLNSPKTQVPLGPVQTIGKNFGFNNGQHQQYHPPPVPLQNDYGVPPPLYNLPLENRPTPFQNSGGGNYLLPATITDSYGAPQYSELTSSYDNIPVSHDLTSSVPGHIPVSHNSNGAHIGSDENCDTGTQVNLEVPLSSGSGYGGSDEVAADLEVALSQKTKSVSLDSHNEVTGKSSVESKEMDENAHAVSIAKSLHPNSELIKSRDIDFNNIPLKGSRGTYTLSIQSSDGSGSFKSLPPDQILNEGILQSILNAIEQPQYSGIGAIQQTYPQQTTTYLRKNEISSQLKFPEEGKLSHFKDSDSQDSVNAHVVLEAPSSNSTSDTGLKQLDTTSAAPLQFLDNNEIAFYFRNNAEMHSDVTKDNDNPLVKQNKSNEPYSFENKNQYESYVSYKTRNADISYGNISSSNSTIEDKNSQ